MDNAKERVLTALDHVEPDRVPIDLWFTSEVEAMSARYGGLCGPDLRVALGHDLVMTASPNIGASYERAGHGGRVRVRVGRALAVGHQRPGRALHRGRGASAGRRRGVDQLSDAGSARARRAADLP